MKALFNPSLYNNSIRSISKRYFINLSRICVLLLLKAVFFVVLTLRVVHADIVTIDFESRLMRPIQNGAEATNIYNHFGVIFPSRPRVQLDRGNHVLVQGSGNLLPSLLGSRLSCNPLEVEFTSEILVRKVKMTILNQRREFSVSAYSVFGEVDTVEYASDVSNPSTQELTFRRTVELQSDNPNENIVRVEITPPNDCFDLMTVDNIILTTGDQVVKEDMLCPRDITESGLNSNPELWLNYANFCASGEGHIVSEGRFHQNTNGVLHVKDARSWNQGHGIRIENGGLMKSITIDSSISLDDGVSVSNTDTSVTCQIEAVLDRSSMEICSMVLNEAINFEHYDELKLSAQFSARIERGEVEIVLLDINDLEVSNSWNLLPSQEENIWTELRFDIKGDRPKRYVNSIPETGELNEVRRIDVRCTSECRPFKVWLGKLSLHSDHVTEVKSISRHISGSALIELASPAFYTNGQFKIHHDDTKAIQDWLRSIREYPSVDLFAPNGIYKISDQLELFSRSDIRCQSPEKTIFSNSGRSKSGPRILFARNTDNLVDTLSSGSGLPNSQLPEHITISNCQFDANGWNRGDFLSLVVIKGLPSQNIWANNITISNNVFTDRNPPGRDGCDLDDLRCETFQRQHLVVLGVNGATIDSNYFAHGGRIKVGRPGQNVKVTSNILDFVNDNAITFVDLNRGDCEPEEKCLTKNVTIERNIISDPIHSGIFFGGDGERQFLSLDGVDRMSKMALEGVKIIDNIVIGHFQAGINANLPPKSSNITISNNKIISRRPRVIPANANYNVVGIGMRIYNGEAAEVIINNNDIVVEGASAGFTQGGIHLKSVNSTMGFTDLSVTGNIVTCQDCSVIQNGGIWMNSAVHTGYFEANKIIDTQNGIIIDPLEAETSGISIQGNIFLGVAQRLDDAGVLINQNNADSFNGYIQNNIFTGGLGSGIKCVAPQSQIRIMGNTYEGVHPRIMGC